MLIDKKIKAPFMVPKDKFADVQKDKGAAKPLNKVLKVPSKAPPNRKDLSANWDEAFWSKSTHWLLYNYHHYHD